MKIDAKGGFGWWGPEPFADYYDNVQFEGFDDDLVYVREPKHEWPEDKDDWLGRFSQIAGRVHRQPSGPGETLRKVNAVYRNVSFLFPFVVGFCGQPVPGVRVVTHAGWRKHRGSRSELVEYIPTECKTRHAYSLDEVLPLLDPTPAGRGSHHKQVVTALREFFDEFSRLQLDPDGFQEQQSPLFITSVNRDPRRLFDLDGDLPNWTDHSLRRLWNARLSEVGFEQIRPAREAYQEIRMFLGSMASPETVIPAVDDKTMAEIKGHGGKYSFRKAPGEKRGKKKRKS